MNSHIRNFCIIAHIDHGKSTLADRFLEITGTIQKREMRNQMLDQMDLERERGITIKLQPVTMQWQGYQFNLIDTPGHVDFTYEVSRSLQAVEGAILLVDASQGVQAQTIANLELAREHNLTIIPVINKIDLPAANLNEVMAELSDLLKINPTEIYKVSAKSGQGVAELLNAVVKNVPPPPLTANSATRGLIFDSNYNDYRGVVTSVRLIDGQITAGEKFIFLGSGAVGEILEVGIYTPKMQPAAKLTAGQIGYVVTGLKNIRQARVGDTISTLPVAGAALPGYREVKPMVFAGFYPGLGHEAGHLREALDKLRLNDASLTYEGEHSAALGFGFRCGFLGLLHLDIIRERLKREYNVEVIVTTPSVAYEVLNQQNHLQIARGALELPSPDRIKKISEPIVKADIVTPIKYLGNLIKITQEYRGLYLNTSYLGQASAGGRAILHYELPLSAILVDFYDQIKSASAGYASLNYEFAKYQPCDIERLDIMVADEVVEPLATIVYSDEAYRRARHIIHRLKDLLPRQLFEVKIQAKLGGRIIAAERIPALRKDVTAKLYGGDVTRKRKLLEKQKAGKKRMRLQGRLAIPPTAYLALISRQD
ncbi:MAG: elongation factor 4 [Candidatus Kerfeldbacteria bacterium]|nr:elongation factor 4 [Candidatus Kerfeldbacteria bacterium]